MLPVVVDQEYWMMYFNGSLMKKGAGVGLVFVLPLRIRMRYMVRIIHFPSPNNVAEYEALINACASPSSWVSNDLTSGVTPSWSSTKS